MTGEVYNDYKKKYLKYKTKYFKLKGGLVGVTDDDYNRLTDKPAIFNELYNLNIQFNNNLRDRNNHWNISRIPEDDFRLIPKMNPDNSVNQTYQRDGEEYFYNHVFINNIFRYAFEQGYTNSGNRDFQILKNTFKSINKIYLIDYQNIVGQMHNYRGKYRTDINNGFQYISNSISLLNILQGIINRIVNFLQTIQTTHGNILISECREKLTSYQIAHQNIEKIVKLINHINSLHAEYTTLSDIKNKIDLHTEKLRQEELMFDKTQQQYKAKQEEYKSSVDKYNVIKKTGIQKDIENAKSNSAIIKKEENTLYEKRENYKLIMEQAKQYIAHLKAKYIKIGNIPETISELTRQLGDLKATLISPPQSININDDNIFLSSQEILKTHYSENINNITSLMQNIEQYLQIIQQIQTTLNNTNQYIINNLNIDFNVHTIIDAINILGDNNNYILYLTTGNKLLDRKNIFNKDYKDDTYASAFEVAFTIIRHNIEALRAGRKNLYILCGHRYPNFRSNIENDINDALKIFCKCFSRSTYQELDISNIVSIQCEFRKPRSDIYANSNGFDDFMFWILGISISSIIHGCFENNPENFVTYIQPDGIRNLNYSFNISDLKNSPPRLILLTNDTQKLNDRTGDGAVNKNLYSELLFLYQKINIHNGDFQYKIYVNGYENRYLNICLYDLLIKLVQPENDNNLPNKFSVHGHEKLNRCVQTREDSKLNLGATQQQKTNINNLINNIKEFIQNDCTEFEKFMVLVKYLQQIYFGAVHDAEQINEYALTSNTIEKFFTNQNI